MHSVWVSCHRYQYGLLGSLGRRGRAKASQAGQSQAGRIAALEAAVNKLPEGSEELDNAVEHRQGSGIVGRNLQQELGTTHAGDSAASLGGLARA